MTKCIPRLNVFSVVDLFIVFLVSYKIQVILFLRFLAFYLFSLSRLLHGESLY